MREAGEALAPGLGQHDRGLLEERRTALDRRLAHAQDKVDRKLEACVSAKTSVVTLCAALDDVTRQLNSVLDLAATGGITGAQKLAQLQVRGNFY